MADVKRKNPAKQTQSRQERALATRRRMMEAAYRLFGEGGYTRTTMADVASEAGVAVQTVYFTFHTKADLLQAAYEHAVSGPDRTPPHLTEWWAAAEAATTVEEALAHFVVGTMQLLERAAPLVRAVQGEADATSAYEFNERLRRDGYAGMVAIFVAKAPLRPGLTESKARDVLLTVLGPNTYFAFTRELGWSADEVADWSRTLLLRELFGIG